MTSKGLFLSIDFTVSFISLKHELAQTQKLVVAQSTSKQQNAFPALSAIAWVPWLVSCTIASARIVESD
jgi:hypothetical protein